MANVHERIAKLQGKIDALKERIKSDQSKIAQIQKSIESIEENEIKRLAHGKDFNEVIKVLEKHFGNPEQLTFGAAESERDIKPQDAQKDERVELNSSSAFAGAERRSEA